MTSQNRYASYKAIESDAKNDDTQWLTYWVVYSVLMIAESFADYSVFWIPGYRFAKCGFIFWLASPRFKGALMLYDKCIRETLKKAEPIIDSVSAQLAKGDLSAVQKELAPATELLQKYGSEAFEKGMTAAAGAAKLAQEELAKANANAPKKD